MALSSSDATVECEICYEDCRQQQAILVDDNKLCAACFDDSVKPLFDRALKYDIAFPPVWATATLRLEDFEGRFSDEFVGLWRARQAEMGSQSGATRDPEAFVGQVCGKDYQWCPECNMPVILKDGCNTIICGRNSCRQHFCFICGVKAHHDSNHWQEGSACPRWLQPDSPRASHDAPPEAQPQQADVHEHLLFDIEEALDNAEAASDRLISFYWKFKADMLKIGLQAWRRIAAGGDQRENEVIETLDLLLELNEFFNWAWSEEVDRHQLIEDWREHRQAYFAAKKAKDRMLPEVLQQYPELVSLCNEFFAAAKDEFTEVGRKRNLML